MPNPAGGDESLLFGCNQYQWDALDIFSAKIMAVDYSGYNISIFIASQGGRYDFWMQGLPSRTIMA
jgi:hypothetical protein